MPTPERPAATSSRLAGWKAELEPLRGKYYGSHIKLTGPNGESDLIKVWVTGDPEPSERELADWGGPFEISDSHYETAFGYEVCKLIVEAINDAS